MAITTLYPWKVKEFAEAEGEASPFSLLDADITRVLTTILVATTRVRERRISARYRIGNRPYGVS